jgi:hypothetical protein
MSPTSYQAAPPRVLTIAEEHDLVKFPQICNWKGRGRLPGFEVVRLTHRDGSAPMGI